MMLIAEIPEGLTVGEQAILRRLEKAPLDLRWGRSGWCVDYLPKPAKRSDFDSLCKRKPALVEIEAARLVLVVGANTSE
jgi:hypothetical protein